MQIPPDMALILLSLHLATQVARTIVEMDGRLEASDNLYD